MRVSTDSTARTARPRAQEFQRRLSTTTARLHRSHAVRLFTVGQAVGQPTRTVADIGDPARAADPSLARIPRQRFCPDTEEVTGSNPVSPTSGFPYFKPFRAV
jgi:hypothetical protein